MLLGRSLATVVLCLVASTDVASGFCSRPLTGLGSSSATALHFNVPSFQPQNEDSGKDTKKDETKKLGLKGLIQLVAAGAGSPFLGDYEGTDPETGKMMFSLEANNLVDEAGNSKQTKMPYFESGWVADEDAEKERQRKSSSGGEFKLPWQK